MNKLILTLSFIIYTCFCHAFTLEVNKWNDFEGKLGKSDIRLSIYLFENGNIKGNYCYKKYETKIPITGQLKGNKIKLTELINSVENGYFTAKIFTDDQDRIEGEWISSDKTKTLELKLMLSSICYGTYENRYSEFDGTNDEVENFMKSIKSSILANDKKWIARHVYYPLNVTINKKAVVIKNEKQLIDNFDKIFYTKFKEKIKATYACNLFTNYQGAMLGSGEIWINTKIDSAKGKRSYYITTINN